MLRAMMVVGLSCSLISIESAVAQSQASDSAAVVHRLERYADAVRTGPVDTIVAAFTTDGQLVLPGMATIRGQAAIQAFLAPMAAASNVESCSMTAETVEISGPVAYEWGDYAQRAGEKGKPAADYHGRFVARLQRGGNGEWRIARLFMQPAPPGS